MKQILMAFLQCAAFTKKGPRCSFRARFAGSFCGHHLTGRPCSPRSPG
jgi:hypothetical protein